MPELTHGQLVQLASALHGLATTLAGSGAPVSADVAAGAEDALTVLTQAAAQRAHHIFHCPACHTDQRIDGLIPHDTVVACGAARCGWAGHASMPNIITKTVGPDGAETMMPHTPPGALRHILDPDAVHAEAQLARAEGEKLALELEAAAEAQRQAEAAAAAAVPPVEQGAA